MHFKTQNTSDNMADYFHPPVKICNKLAPVNLQSEHQLTSDVLKTPVFAKLNKSLGLWRMVYK